MQEDWPMRVRARTGGPIGWLDAHGSYAILPGTGGAPRSHEAVTGLPSSAPTGVMR